MNADEKKAAERALVDAADGLMQVQSTLTKAGYGLWDDLLAIITAEIRGEADRLAKEETDGDA